MELFSLPPSAPPWACFKLYILCVKVQESSATCDKLSRGQRPCNVVSEECLFLHLQLIHAEVMHYGNYYQTLLSNICSP